MGRKKVRDGVGRRLGMGRKKVRDGVGRRIGMV